MLMVRSMVVLSWRKLVAGYVHETWLDAVRYLFERSIWETSLLEV